jgi:molybdopterin converting factor small subunit
MKIHVPTPLRTYTDQKETVEVTAVNVSGALHALVEAHPGLKTNLFASDGNLRSFVNIYLNDEDLRYLPQKDQTPVTEKDELTIIPSIAGGCCCM